MDAETLQRVGTKILFKKDLEAYGSAVAQILREAYVRDHLGDPQTVLKCLDTLYAQMIKLYKKWCPLMESVVSDDDHPDPEPGKDGGNVRLNTLAERELHELLGRPTFGNI